MGSNAHSRNLEVSALQCLLKKTFLQVGDDGSVLPATEDEVFQSLVSGSGNVLSSFNPGGRDRGEDEEEDGEDDEDDEETEYDTDEDEPDERARNSKTLRPRYRKSLQGLQL